MQRENSWNGGTLVPSSDVIVAYCGMVRRTHVRQEMGLLATLQAAFREWRGHPVPPAVVREMEAMLSFNVNLRYTPILIPDSDREDNVAPPKTLDQPNSFHFLEVLRTATAFLGSPLVATKDCSTCFKNTLPITLVLLFGVDDSLLREAVLELLRVMSAKLSTMRSAILEETLNQLAEISSQRLEEHPGISELLLLLHFVLERSPNSFQEEHILRLLFLLRKHRSYRSFVVPIASLDAFLISRTRSLAPIIVQQLTALLSRKCLGMYPPLHSVAVVSELRFVLAAISAKEMADFLPSLTAVVCGALSTFSFHLLFALLQTLLQLSASVAFDGTLRASAKLTLIRVADSGREFPREVQNGIVQVLLALR